MVTQSRSSRRSRNMQWIWRCTLMLRLNCEVMISFVIVGLVKLVMATFCLLGPMVTPSSRQYRKKKLQNQIYWKMGEGSARQVPKEEHGSWGTSDGDVLWQTEAVLWCWRSLLPEGGQKPLGSYRGRWEHAKDTAGVPAKDEVVLGSRRRGLAGRVLNCKSITDHMEEVKARFMEHGWCWIKEGSAEGWR